MYKNILFLTMIIIAIVGTIFLFRQPKNDANAKIISSSASNPTFETVAQYPTQDKDGIEISVTKIDQTNDTTILTLSLSNHQYDLSQDTIFDEMLLNEQPSQSHTILSNAAGGHHVEASIVFNKTTTGSMKISPTKDTTFIFNDIW